MYGLQHVFLFAFIKSLAESPTARPTPKNKTDERPAALPSVDRRQLRWASSFRDDPISLNGKVHQQCDRDSA